jgi:hypothetical protein
VYTGISFRDIDGNTIDIIVENGLIGNWIFNGDPQIR